ncbi:RraA family protein [Agromyces bracchium]|uniref:Putative 4-hydroxy-4-methyl-2-oxoglutarate aldolase n=1 Tax=Agromyces bracchium TaxID=88376 RepID=A0A6I3MB81_9MICO|nr:RraA family protein [Agromyces bracchium]MTH70028.1 RraA family protein [Agromyces bracchium]
MTPGLLDRFAELDTAAVSDALDALGLPSGTPGLQALTVDRPVLGFAVTAVMEPYTGGAAGAHILTTSVGRAGPDDVIVVDNAGRTEVSCWGGILGLGASQRGVRGVLVDGACRDVDENRELELAVYARGASPATARGRLQQRSSGEPATIAGRTVHHGDIVYHDATGFVVVPRDRAEAVLTEAQAIVARERTIAEEIRSGRRLRDAMRDARLAGAEENR